LKVELIKNKLFMRVITVVAIVLLVLVLISIFKTGDERFVTSSTLSEVVSISELSTSQFTYNGIAEIYKDEEKQKVKCHIKYKAIVKAGVDMSKIEFEIDKDNKTVKPILPEISLQSVVIDENVLSFIPDNTKVELQDIFTVCKEDAQREASSSTELFDVAEENLKNTVEALLHPILESQEYRVIWE